MGLSSLVPALARIVGRLAEAAALVDPADPSSAAVGELLPEKRGIASAALAAAAGVVVDATADREAPAPGGGFTVTTSVWASSATAAELRAA